MISRAFFGIKDKSYEVVTYTFDDIAAALNAVSPHNWKAFLRERLDSHTPAIFETVRDFVRQSGLLEVQVTVQTPFPGTPLYRRLQREGRLLAERFWDRCTLFDVFEGPPLEPGTRSLAFAVELRAADRTLTDEEAQAVIDRMVAALGDRYGATLRTG